MLHGVEIVFVLFFISIIININGQNRQYNDKNRRTGYLFNTNYRKAVANRKNSPDSKVIYLNHFPEAFSPTGLNSRNSISFNYNAKRKIRAKNHDSRKPSKKKTPYLGVITGGFTAGPADASWERLNAYGGAVINNPVTPKPTTKSPVYNNIPSRIYTRNRVTESSTRIVQSSRLYEITTRSPTEVVGRKSRYGEATHGPNYDFFYKTTKAAKKEPSVPLFDSPKLSEFIGHPSQTTRKRAPKMSRKYYQQIGVKPDTSLSNNDQNVKEPSISKKPWLTPSYPESSQNGKGKAGRIETDVEWLNKKKLIDNVHWSSDMKNKISEKNNGHRKKYLGVFGLSSIRMQEDPASKNMFNKTKLPARNRSTTIVQNYFTEKPYLAFKNKKQNITTRKKSNKRHYYLNTIDKLYNKRKLVRSPAKTTNDKQTSTKRENIEKKGTKKHMVMPVALKMKDLNKPVKDSLLLEDSQTPKKKSIGKGKTVKALLPPTTTVVTTIKPPPTTQTPKTGNKTNNSSNVRNATRQGTDHGLAQKDNNVAISTYKSVESGSTQSVGRGEGRGNKKVDEKNCKNNSNTETILTAINILKDLIDKIQKSPELVEPETKEKQQHEKYLLLPLGDSKPKMSYIHRLYKKYSKTKGVAKKISKKINKDISKIVSTIHNSW